MKSLGSHGTRVLVTAHLQILGWGGGGGGLVNRGGDTFLLSSHGSGQDGYLHRNAISALVFSVDQDVSDHIGQNVSSTIIYFPTKMRSFMVHESKGLRQLIILTLTMKSFHKGRNFYKIITTKSHQFTLATPLSWKLQ